MSEIKTVDLRDYDGIEYLPYNTFIHFYPINATPLGAGGYGKVFASGSKNVVKVFEADPTLTDFAIELNMYASLSHPCIMKPKAWTVRNHVGYLAMKKGENVFQAMKANKITIEEIISDTLSATAYMNAQGIFHGDQKPGNMVFHKSKCKLIDLGIAGKGEEDEDGDYYTTRNLYTENYRDPEYYSLQYNSIKSEIYALGASYMQFLNNNTVPQYGDLYTYDAGIPHIDWIISRAKRFVHQRPDIDILIRDAPDQLLVRRHVGQLFRQPIITPNPDCGKDLMTLTSWLVEVAYDRNLRMKTVFLGLHLVHRAMGPHTVEYSDLTNFQVFGCVCMHLACAVTNDIRLDITEWKHYSDDPAPLAQYTEKFSNMTLNILANLRGLLSTLTYWDYAKSKEDLLPLLNDIMKCNYNPDKIRILEPEGYNNKCVRIKAVITKQQIPVYKRGVTDMWEPISPVEDPHIYSCELNTEENKKYVEDMWNIDWYIHSKGELIGSLMHNRGVLDELKLEIAQRICASLYAKRQDPLYSFILDTICAFDWRSSLATVLNTMLHPFRITGNDIII